MNEYADGYIGALCAAFSLGALLAGILVTLIFALFFDEQ